MHSQFSDAAPVKVKLLQGALYSEEAAAWRILMAHSKSIEDYFRDLGLSLVIDPNEGWAYLEQQDLEGEPEMVQLFKRRPLSFEATVLLLILREELLRFDGTPRATETVPTVTQKWLVDELSAFVRSQNNEVRRESGLKAVVRQAVSMGVLREIRSSGDETTYQILRIVKAKLPDAKISEVRERLKAPPPEDDDDDDTENGDQPAD
jgi:hypothetical protein